MEERPEWTRVEAFGDDPEAITLYTTTARANTEYAAELLLDPLPLLVENIPEVEGSWSVSVERVNGQIGVGLGKPPRKALFTWTVIPSLNLVHGVLYRLPPDGATA